MKFNPTEFVLWFFLGCLAVLVITRAQGFATAVTAVGGQVRGAGSLLTGAGISQAMAPNPDAAFLAQVQKG